MTVAAATMVTPVAAPKHEVAAVERAVATTTTTTMIATTAPPTTVAPTTTSTTTTTTTTTAAPTTTVPVTVPPTTAPPTTPPPTTTAAVVASVPPATTVPVSALPSTFLGGGTGSPMALTAPSTDAGLFNWDQAVDPQPGVSLARNPDSLIELSNPKVLVWSRPIAADTTLSGQLAVDVWVAAAGFDAGSLGVVDAGAAVCQSPMAGCTTIGSGTNGFLQSDYGDGFGHLVIYLGAVDTALPTGSYLVTSISASVNSSTDLLVAYGTSAYPSQLRFW